MSSTNGGDGVRAMNNQKKRAAPPAAAPPFERLD
jgi:hypothetical protein